MDRLIVLHRLRTLTREITMMNESVFQEHVKNRIFDIEKDVYSFSHKTEEQEAGHIRLTIYPVNISTDK
jgi:hypothetical protein